MKTGGYTQRVASLALDLSPCNQPVADATVVSWNPLQLQIRAWSFKLDALEFLMEHKCQRGDIDAFTSSAKDYIDAVDKLTTHAVSELRCQRQFLQKLLSESLAVIFMVSMLLYLWLPWLGVFTDAVCITIMLAWCYLLESQKRKLTDFLEAHKCNADERLRQFCENYLASFEPRAED